MSYTVAIDAFHGPLDLLLFLVKRNEVDILDIPIATITDQFHEYLQVMRELDLDLAGEFVVMAATLMEIKSRMLLPGEEEEAGDDRPDPRRELVKQLLEYRTFKDAAAALEERAERQGTRLTRQEPAEPATTAGPTVRPVELWDLVSVFARLMRETQFLETATIAVDDTPQHIYESQLRDRVKAEGRIVFRAAFVPPHTKVRLIGVFLAILELIRRGAIGLDQMEPDGEIWLVQLAEQPVEPEGGESPSDTNVGR
jgi:segregation and condensation protein A